MTVPLELNNDKVGDFHLIGKLFQKMKKIKKV